MDSYHKQFSKRIATVRSSVVTGLSLVRAPAVLPPPSFTMFLLSADMAATQSAAPLCVTSVMAQA